MTAPLDPTTERMLRELAPRVLGAVLRRRVEFGAAEDAVQEALLAAWLDWPRGGVPQNPGGWLFRVALRRLDDRGDSDRARRAREEQVAAQRHEAAAAPTAEMEFEPVPDETLTLLFTCCHPALQAPSAIALTLRAVGGLTTAEIARAFLVPEPTMAQRISRAKQSIAASGVPFAQPAPAQRRERLAAVLQVLYLIYNEGHTGSSGAELQRIELAHEAIRLARLLHGLLPDEPEVQGLLALLLLSDARAAARTGPGGELIPLDEQDRSRWDRSAIAEGTALIEAAMARGAVGSYQVQAAIAALHAEAADTASTDWAQILALYEVLRRLSPSPMVELSHTVAAAMVHGPEHGLDRLLRLQEEPKLAGSHRLLAVRAHLLERQGRSAEAVENYKAAALRTLSVPERQYLLGKAARLQAP